MKKIRILVDQILLLIFCNCVVLWEIIKISQILKIPIIILLCGYFIHFLTYSGRSKAENRKLHKIWKGTYLIKNGTILLLLDMVIGVAIMIFSDISFVRKITNFLFGIIISSLVLFSGILIVAFSSRQIKLRYHILLFFTWYIPLINVFVLLKINKIALNEYRFEQAKLDINNLRQESEICKTKYPILLVHGIFFRDWQLVNYWGRIPKELVKNGAIIYYGNQQSANLVENSAKELRERIFEVLEESGAKKINIIAHSKGGLDSRYAISRLGMDKYVASLTTINTPHYGCKFVDKIISKVPGSVFDYIDGKYNKIFKVLGDNNPSFKKGVVELTYNKCKNNDLEIPDSKGVFYQSVMSQMNSGRAAGFPLNLGYMLNKSYGKGNDGLVTIESGLRGKKAILIDHKGNRGISHGDMIDLFRENIKDFDVREFYVNLVRELKNNGF